MIKIEVEAGKLTAYLKGLSEKFNTAALEEINDSLTDVQSEMKVAGKPVTYPIQWDSEKQRRYVMWKLSKEGNLPYKRTGAYQAGWRLEKMVDGYALSNKHPAGAIGGTWDGKGITWQSKIHRGRWPVVAKLVFDALSDIVGRIIERMSK